MGPWASKEEATSLGTSRRPNAALALRNSPLLHLIVRRKRFANAVMELVVSLRQRMPSGQRVMLDTSTSETLTKLNEIHGPSVGSNVTSAR